MDAIFQDPTETQSFIEPGRYVIKVVKLEAMPPSEQHPDWKASVRYTLNLAKYPSLELVRDQNEEPYEWWQYSSVALSKGARGRQWVEAFLGRPLVEGQDTGEAIGQALIGCKAIAMVGPNAKGKDAILGALQPYTDPKGGKAQAADAPRPEMVAELESDLPAEQRSGVPAF